MNESSKEMHDGNKGHDATRALQSVAEDIERERSERGRADSDPRGESKGLDEATAPDPGPAVPAQKALDELGVPDALRPVPVQARTPH